MCFWCGPQIMLPLSHLCGELVEHRSMCEAHRRLADDLAAGGCHVSQPKKKARKGGGGGGAGSYQTPAIRAVFRSTVSPLP